MTGRTSAVCILALLALAACAANNEPGRVRFATFNAAMGLAEAGALQSRLAAGDDPALLALAEIIRTVRPDVLLINEFDFQPGFDSAGALNRNYLDAPRAGLEPISYAWTFRAPVNTGVPSGLDLDGDGSPGSPADAWGFGMFPGQYGMLVLSRFPIDRDGARSFREFLWKDMPDALEPSLPDNGKFYSKQAWSEFRLSSKSHWDLPVQIGTTTIHFLVSHPTPPVFDGEEDRNGRRNHDEIRFWADYVVNAGYIYDDAGRHGGLDGGARFVVAGDQNSDPFDGDSHGGAITQLLSSAAIDSSCTPASEGASEATAIQGGANGKQRGNPAYDTSDFSDRVTGNLRLDYVLPSVSLDVLACGVFWPPSGHAQHGLISHSDHRMTWLDVKLPSTN